MNQKSDVSGGTIVDLIPLSRAQYGMWLADTLPGGPPVNIAHYLEIEGPIDLDAFARAVNDAGHEMESLLVRVVESDGRPYQFVDHTMEYDEPVLDFSGDADPVAAALEWMSADYSTKALDLSRDQLAVTRLIRVGRDRYFWYARAHHLVVDGYGAFNSLTRCAEHYNALLEGRAPAPLVAATLHDVAEAERAYRESPRFEADRAYWLDKVSGLPKPASLSGRTARWAKDDRVAGQELPSHLSDALDRFAEDLHASEAQVVIAAFAAFLARMTGTDDVVLSMPVSGRVTKRLRNAAAMLANMVPIRFAVGASTTVEDIVRASVSELVAAMRHQLYRFEDLRRESDALDASANSFGPIVNILFFDSEIRMGSALGRYRALTSGTLDDLQLNMYRSGADAPLLIELHGNGNLYGQDELETHAARFIEFLRRLLESPRGTPIAAIDLLDTAERSRIVGDLAGRDGARPSETLVELLARQAAATPEAIAVTSGDISLTYRDLDERSNRFARRLIARGVGPESLVAIAMPRGAEVVAATLGVLKTGAGYLPLDLAHPADRLEYILADADPILTVTSGDVRDRVPGDPARVVLFDGTGRADGDFVARPIIDTDRIAPLRSDQLAYVIYTSGSTGRPKGVAITHRSVSTYLVNSCAEAGIRAGDVWTFFHSYAFDYSIWEIFGPLVTGGRVVVVDSRTTRSPADVVRLVAREGVTVFSQTPSAFYQFAAARQRYADAGEPDGPLSLRLVLLSGEALQPALLANWYDRNPALPTLVNSYGITETTVFVTYLGLSSNIAVAGAPSAIGPALPGLRTYVLDQRLQPVPLGAWGEIYVAGEQLARGYLNRPSLSASRFVADPFGEPGGRLYRSGDIVRWNNLGELEYRGRGDQQVQLRGFRIELDEIRNALTGHDSVASAAVIVRHPDTEAAGLVGYVVPEPGTTCDPETLRAHVGSVLPEYMIPVAIVTLDELPLTVNGKLDLRALPEPVFESAAPYVEPRTVAEGLIADVFAEVLGTDRVGVLDSFFDLGGNSITATSAVVRIAEVMGCEVSVRDLFGHPTVARLATRLSEAERTTRPPLRAVHRSDPIPLAPAQNRIWMLNQADPTSGAYNIPLVLRLTGTLDIAALRAALTDVIERHETLRTVYPVVNGQGAQVILPAHTVVAELTPMVGPDDPDEMKALIGTLVSAGTDLRTDPPIRITLLSTPDRAEHVLVVVLHHICCDGWSLRPLAADVAGAYAARVEGKSPEWRPLDVHYADYSIWHRALLGDENDPASLSYRQLDYWTRRLVGKPPLLEIPADRPRPARPSLRGEVVTAAIAAETFAGIERLARASNVTTFVVVHAALAVLLARLSGEQDITIGTPVAGRGERALEPLVGMFVNTVPLRTEIRSDESFAAFLTRVGNDDVDAFAHGDLPYERIVDAVEPRRSMAYAPLCQVYLVLENTGRAKVALSDLTVEVLDRDAEPAKVDLIVTVAENVSDGGDVVVRINYATDLFDRESMEVFAERWTRLLAEFVAEPRRPVGAVNILSAWERQALVPASGVAGVGSHVLCDMLCVRDADAVAVVSGSRSVSYGELDEWSSRLARLLMSEGVGPGDVVGLVMGRCAELVAGMWAVTKSGAGFVLVDPRYPVERVAGMLADAGVGIALSVSESLAVVPGGVRVVALDGPAARADLADYSPEPVTDLDRVRPSRVSDVAYVLFTSGSTGVPKGVMVTHEGLANFAAEQAVRYSVDESSRVLAVAAPGFDAVMLELLMAHVCGAALVVAPPEVFAGAKLAELIAGSGCHTPS